MEISDLIFDAEKRWALDTPARWGGSERCDLIFDAEKRWARVNSRIKKTKEKVIWSLMLKSVEHRWLINP